MDITPEEQRVLHALAEAGQEHKELAELLDFYYELYQLQFQAKARIPEPDIRDPMAMRWRLEGGIPQLTFDQLNVEPEEMARLVDEITAVLVRHNPGWQATEQEWTPDTLMVEARRLFETWETLTGGPGEEGEPSTPSLLAVGFALAPYLKQAAEAIAPHLDLGLWQQGYCPVCGGRPNLALLEAERGGRELICSRCNCQWSYSRVGCPYCRSKEKQTYYSNERGTHRLYVCPQCKGYLKTVDLRELQREVFPPVERLLTVSMDLAARQEGLGV